MLFKVFHREQVNYGADNFQELAVALSLAHAAVDMVLPGGC